MPALQAFPIFLGRGPKAVALGYRMTALRASERGVWLRRTL